MQLPNMPISLGVWLAHDTYTGHGSPRTISATTLLKSTRQIVLSRRVDPTLAIPNVNSLLASRIGTAIHKAIEDAWLSKELAEAITALGQQPDKYVVNPTGPVPEGKIAVYVEVRKDREIDGWIVTGQIDISIGGQLHDVKTTKGFVVKKKLHHESWKKQGSIYRWLNPEVIQDDSMVVECVVLDWTAADAASDPEYPQQQWTSIVLQLIPEPVIESFIRQKLAEITTYLDTDEHLIPECTDEELWREPPKYAYYANPEATGRSTRNFDSLMEANKYLAEKGKGRVDVRPGVAKACAYCPAASLCSQRLKYINE